MLSNVSNYLTIVETNTGDPWCFHLGLAEQNAASATWSPFFLLLILHNFHEFLDVKGRPPGWRDYMTLIHWWPSCRNLLSGFTCICIWHSCIACLLAWQKGKARSWKINRVVSQIENHRICCLSPACWVTRTSHGILHFDIFLSVSYY